MLVTLIVLVASTMAVADNKTDKQRDDQAVTKPEVKPPRKPGPDDAKAQQLLEKIVTGPDRKARIAELTKLAPH
ncbi:MAG TPA: hypothetical protein VK427_10305, partial [Kofleriaceae bacterium]|nr:hypothetical protein [Kofleriaceae bacterium]